MPSAVPVDYNPFPDMEPGGFPLTSQDQASRFVNQASRAVTPMLDSLGNALSLPGRALYGPESAGWDRYGQATPDQALNAAGWVTMPALGRAAMAGGATRDLMSMSGAGEKPPWTSRAIPFEGDPFVTAPPPRPANDPALTGPDRVGSYRTALTDQKFNQYVTSDTPIKDVEGWTRYARELGIVSEGDKPNPVRAAIEASGNGRTAILLTSDGRRMLYHDGALISRDFSADLAPRGGGADGGSNR